MTSICGATTLFTVLSPQAARDRIESIGINGYSARMTIKEKVVQVVQDMPENGSIEDAMERLLLLSKIERGAEQADRGQTLSHEEVKQRMAKWLK
jgi:hypothetical protein